VQMPQRTFYETVSGDRIVDASKASICGGLFTFNLLPPQLKIGNHPPNPIVESAELPYFIWIIGKKWIGICAA